MCAGVGPRYNMFKLSQKYRKTLNVCGIKISRCTENDILAQISFGVQEIPWPQIIIKENLMLIC